MPTTTELIPCIMCGKPRPIVVHKRSDAVRASQARCAECRRGFQPYTTNIECPQCGNTRPIYIYQAKELHRAQTRVCHNCNTANLPNNQTANHPDVDETAVDHLVAGHKITVTPAERRQAVAYLTRRQMSARVIAERIGCTTRTVERHRQRLAS